MNYLEWNNIVAEYFFNPRNAGKDVYLYITKIDIINLARQQSGATSDRDVWNDFINAIKGGLPGAGGNIASKAKSCYERRNLLSIDKTQIRFPPYITYLVFFVLPLIEDIDGNYNSNNYYGRLNKLLTNNQIDQALGVSDFRDNNMNLLWLDLGNWANIKQSGDLGRFRVMPFKNANWIYVGKPFSQCILPPKATAKLPELFLQAGMIPNSFYSVSEIKKMLLTYGPSVLSLNHSVIDLIKKSDSNELGQSVIEIAKREYNKWSGETHQAISNGATQRIKRNYTVVPLLMQFKVNENEGQISFSFRIYSTNDYPEDLKIGQYENLYETNGWSKTLEIEFKESFELKDNFNKWIARFPQKDVRLFINAGNFQLSTGYWIETEILSRTDPMFLFCKNDKRESILAWGNTFRRENFTEEDLEGLPQGYSLFRILNPVTSHPNITLLTLHTEKIIELVGGLKVNFRTFINDFPPEIEILSSDGNEKVFLQYRNTEEKIFLVKKQLISNRWILPEDIMLNVDFYIKVEDESFPGNDIGYNITTSNNAYTRVDGMQLPKRDSFGRRTSDDLNQYCLGSNIVNPTRESQRFYCAWENLFITTNEDLEDETATVSYNNHCGNMLSSFLTLKEILTTEDFYKAFEFYYSKEFSLKQLSGGFNLTRTKKLSLNFYDYIGFLDYDYETKTIVINPPQFIFIPSNKGRKVLLIGGKDEALVNEIIKIAPQYNLQVTIKRQLSSNERLLLPDVIIIKSFGKASAAYGERNLISLAQELKVSFSNSYFPQLALQLFSEKISDYEKALKETAEDDYDWARTIFNPETLTYERDESQKFNKSFSLIEYKLNEYTFYNKLWKDGKCYQVDKDWGRYICLKHYKRNVILFDSMRSRVAIPWETPLPRLLSESIMLLSGFAPIFEKIDDIYYRIYENIPGVFTENLFKKLGQQPINRNLL